MRQVEVHGEKWGGVFGIICWKEVLDGPPTSLGECDLVVGVALGMAWQEEVVMGPHLMMQLGRQIPRGLWAIFARCMINLSKIRGSADEGGWEFFILRLGGVHS